MSSSPSVAGSSASRRQRILGLALPIIGGSISQNILNLVDTAMVGRLGSEALAAVGMASILTFTAAAFIIGMSSGVQAMAARRLGAGDTGTTAIPLNGGLLLALALAIPWSIFLFTQAEQIFHWINDDPEVVRIGVPYMQVRFIALAAISMNFAFRGYFNGVNRSGLYLRTLLIMHTVNIVLNYVLIFGHFGAPALGATGAGIGTTVATFVGTGTYIFLALRYARESGFLRALPDRQTFRTLLSLALPSGIQQLFFAAGFSMLYWIIGKVGTVELAAANILTNVTLVTILPAMALGLASASLVGQALGRQDPQDAKRWAWDVVKFAIMIMAPLGIPMVFMPDMVFQIFTSDAPTILAGRLPLQIVGGFIVFDSIGLVLLNSMLGAGAARTVMAVSVSLQWLLFLPVAFIVGPTLGFGLMGIWIAQAVQRGVQAAVFTALWQRGGWQSAKA